MKNILIGILLIVLLPIWLPIFMLWVCVLDAASGFATIDDDVFGKPTREKKHA